MISREKAQAILRFLLCKVFIITQKWGRKLTFSCRFSNFIDCTRVFAVHIQSKFSSHLPKDGKNSQKMRFDAITGLKTGFRSEAKVNPGSIRGQSFTRGTGALSLFELTAGQTGEFPNREIVIVLISDLRRQLIHKVNVFFVQIRVPTF